MTCRYRSQPDRVTLPTSLEPTTLQRTVAHHGYVDAIPFPTMRDRIIAQPQFTYTYIDALLRKLSDTVTIHLDFGSSSAAAKDESLSSDSMIRSCMDHHYWECSEDFCRQFLGVIDSQVLNIANKWRRLRGELPMSFDTLMMPL